MTQDGPVLRVLTLNLWGTNGPVRRRLADLAAYLGATRPDVVALQEVAAWGSATQAHHLAEAAGYPVVAHVRTGHLRGEGLAVLIDATATSAATVALPKGAGDHPRALQQVDVDCDGTVVRVANTHLAWRLDATTTRTAQAEAVRDALAGVTGPLILVGDLNDVPGSRPLGVLTARGGLGLVDCCAAAGSAGRPTLDPANPFTWQPALTNRRVDHVLARGFDLRDVAVVLTGTDAPVVSDHYGVRATLGRPHGVGIAPGSAAGARASSPRPRDD